MLGERCGFRAGVAIPNFALVKNRNGIEDYKHV